MQFAISTVHAKNDVPIINMMNVYAKWVSQKKNLNVFNFKLISYAKKNKPYQCTRGYYYWQIPNKINSI